MRDFLHQLLHTSSPHCINWQQQLQEVLHAELEPAAAAQLATWLAQQPQVVRAVAEDAQQLQTLIKRNVKHAAALQLLLAVRSGLQQQQDENAAPQNQQDAAAQTQAAGANSSSSSSSDRQFLQELLLDILATESTGDALSVLLQGVQLPAGLLEGAAAAVAVHASKAAAVARCLPQLLQLGLPPYVKVKM
jgi:hypothetical protein